jgi:hypothetical protein
MEFEYDLEYESVLSEPELVYTEDDKLALAVEAKC